MRPRLAAEWGIVALLFFFFVFFALLALLVLVILPDFPTPTVKYPSAQ